MSIREERRRRRQEESQRRGEEQRQRNVEKATRQKRTALERGGKFSEGGTITQVRKGDGTPNQQGGRTFKREIQDSVGISEGVGAQRTQRRDIQDSVTTRDTRDTKTTKQEKQDSSFAIDVKGTATAPPITQKRDERLDNLLGKNINFDRVITDDLKQGFDTLVNFGRDILLSKDLLGTPLQTPQQKEASILVKEGRKETSLDLISEGKLKEAFEKKGFRGSITTGILIGAAPFAPKVKSQIGIDVSKATREAKIIQLEKEFGLKGESQKLPQGGKITGVGQEVVITGAPTEKGTPQAFFISEFGKGKTKRSIITPSKDEPITLRPESLKIGGKLADIQKVELEAQKQFPFSDFRFKTDLPTKKSRDVFRTGISQSEIKIFAKEQALKTQSGKTVIDPKKKVSVFAQTKAEKLEPSDIPKSTRTPTKPLTDIPTGKGGAGQVGKAGTFTKQQEKIIREFKTPPKQEPKQKLENLFTAPISPSPATAQQIQTVEIVTTPKPQEVIKEGSIVAPTITPTKQDQKLETQVTPKGGAQQTPPIADLKLTDEVITKKGTGTTTTPTTDLTFKTELDIRKITTHKPEFPEVPPFTPQIIITQPPPELPKIIPVFIPPPPLISGDGGGGLSRGKTRKGFFGNVPQDSIVGIVRKAPTITVSEGRGFRASQFKEKKTKKSKKKKGLLFSDDNGVSLKIPKMKKINFKL